MDSSQQSNSLVFWHKNTRNATCLLNLTMPSSVAELHKCVYHCLSQHRYRSYALIKFTRQQLKPILYAEQIVLRSSVNGLIAFKKGNECAGCPWFPGCAEVGLRKASSVSGQLATVARHQAPGQPSHCTTASDNSWDVPSYVLVMCQVKNKRPPWSLS